MITSIPTLASPTNNRRRCRCLYFGTSTRDSSNQLSYIVSDRSGKSNPLSHRAIVLCARPDEHGIIENPDGATGLRQLRWYLAEEGIRPAISSGVVFYLHALLLWAALSLLSGAFE